MDIWLTQNEELLEMSLIVITFLLGTFSIMFNVALKRKYH